MSGNIILTTVTCILFFSPFHRYRKDQWLLEVPWPKEVGGRTPSQAAGCQVSLTRTQAPAPPNSAVTSPAPWLSCPNILGPRPGPPSPTIQPDLCPHPGTHPSLALQPQDSLPSPSLVGSAACPYLLPTPSSSPRPCPTPSALTLSPPLTRLPEPPLRVQGQRSPGAECSSQECRAPGW